MVLGQGQGPGPVFNEDRGSVWEDENVLETDGGDGHTTSMPNATELCV